MPGFAMLAAVCAGVFAGAAIYITVVEHPARLACGTTLAHTEFGPSYRRAAAMQASLALVGGSSALAAWLTGCGAGWLVGGLLLASVIPVTLVVILPTNRALLAIAPGQEHDRVAALLTRWGQLHAVRSVLGAAAFVLMVALLARGC